MIAAPVILYPKTNWTASGEDTYYSDSLIQKISGDIPVISGEVERNTLLTVQYTYHIENASGSTAETAPSYVGITVGSTLSTVTSIPWAFDSESVITYAVGDTVKIKFYTVKVSSFYGEIGPVLDTSIASVLNVIVVAEDQIQASVLPVSSVKLKRFTDRIKILVPKLGVFLNPNCEFAGCNFYLSLVAGGGVSGYVPMNTVLVTDTDAAETEETVISDTAVTAVTDNLEIDTVKKTQFVNEFYTFTMDRSVLTRLIREGKIPNIYMSDGQTLSSDVIYYFVATAVVFDSSFNETKESTYSAELEGAFVQYTTTYQTLPKRSRSDVLFTISRDLMQNNDVINVVPGSVVRDMLDPIALQFENFYVIEDFIFATLSIDTLLLFDDQNGDGISDAVVNSSRKTALLHALGITDPVNLQLLIDQQFDKLASNYAMVRKGATKAVGSVLFYSNIRPTQDILIPDGATVTSVSDTESGTPSMSFSVRGSQIMDINNLDHYYNPTLKRYELEADIEAQITGSLSNVPAGSITISRNLIPTIQVINNVPTRYGTDRETNHELANRIKLARISYDSGTEGGYADTAYDVPGILQARVEKAGDPLMMRDYDSATGKHIGGKVDVYIKGVSKVQYIDQIAFKYDYPTDTYGNKIGENFSVINAREFMLKTVNQKVTDSSPIVSVSRVRNITRSKDYSLSNLSIINGGNTVLLEKNYQNIAIGMATLDVIEVSYLYRSSNRVVLANQPVESIVSVTSSQNVLVDTSKYALVKSEDVLQNGRSSISADSVKFFFNVNDAIPEFVQITDESHVMLLDTPARLVLKGVDQSSIVVASGSTVFINNVDYTISAGSESVYTYLNLTSTSKIRHGDVVLVSYKASENFNVTYIHNGLVQNAQVSINKMKHACADSIVKEAVQNFVDISFRVVKKTGIDSNLIKARLQTAVANYISGLKMGDTFTQGALISVVQSVEGVKEIKLPLIRMMKRNSSFIPLDDLGILTFEVYQKTSSSGIASYRTVNPVLSYSTSNGGGDSNLFRGVYENNIVLTMADTAGDVAKNRGMSYIQADGRIIVSTTDGQAPQTKHYKASYYTYYPADVNPVGDLMTSTIEYLDVDSLSMKDIDVLDEKVTKRGL
jgi:hypothetical protein